ncbi:MAG: L-serine dehydratase [Rhodothermales bacterium]|jgi:L-serine dehydratase
MQNPSIFNDVLGPVMRGPSSSHTAASWRIGTLAVDLLDEPVRAALVEFDEQGAWAPNYEEQGTVLGMDGGLLGIDIVDEQIIRGGDIARERGIRIEYRVSRFPTDHANTVRLTLTGESGKRQVMVAVSLGGGMFEARMLGGHPISMQGDYYELVAWTSGQPPAEDKVRLGTLTGPGARCMWSLNESGGFVRVQSSSPIPAAAVEEIRRLGWVDSASLVEPIMPIISGRSGDFPFTTYAEAIAYNATAGHSLGELGIEYETIRSGLDEAAVVGKMRELVGLIESSISTGLAGTSYADRILPQQSHRIRAAEVEGRLPADHLVNRLIENITAIMEAKSAMQVVVAAPTAGGCGALGGTIKAVADARGITEEAKIKAYFAAGIVGVFFARGPGFSAEEGGCQLETGAAACMAAAALVDLCGGTAAQALAAASMALQNTIGLVCDPVADRVEVPCLGKNITAGMNALAASTMALSGFDSVIPLDEVIQTVSAVAAKMPRSHCCTGTGGLAATPTSARLKEELRAGCAC